MRLLILAVLSGALLLASCSDDTVANGLDSGADLLVQKDGAQPDKTAPKPDNTQPKPDYFDPDAIKPDQAQPKPDQGQPKPDQGQPKPDAATASCSAQDAAGVGACKMLIGFKWDGKACPSVTGCSCSGKDCSSLYKSSAACLSAHAHCGTKTKCSKWDAKGVGMCSMFLGYIWDGKQCKGISGCSCGGTDCSRIYPNPTKCAAGQATCP